ncbi:PP2C family protein-serine/threonine phosphatase [Myxococcus xanthus]|uniref:SpoIIE family protein phosphatase n=1 Tax=Myxococcus xanthus TaxID=34 RepID=A0A7Y4IRQ4_MYXXA|nr:PP2C family protein-serine/threonine phosphatase [Myxococcus xanthus]NOJ83485.1 SpoIIE family protein phosphatase [Myxococcus xanthus]NOJ87381.1 SpoIIE family protein phosphatase [Myxococcus xanthus]
MSSTNTRLKSAPASDEFPDDAALPPSERTGTQEATGARESTATRLTGPLGLAEGGTRTLIAPLEAGELPNVAQIKGLRLDQILLLTTGVLVVLIVGLLAALSVASTKSQFEETALVSKERIQEQARELGQTVGQTIALTSATNLRDNNYAFLEEVAGSIVKTNPNILRVQIFDPDGVRMADSEGASEDKEDVAPVRRAERRLVSAFYRGQPISEIQEPIDYGSSSGKGLVVISYSLGGLQKQLASLEQDKRATVRATTLRMLGLGLGFVVLAGVLVAYQSRRITRPLGMLTGKVMQLAAGNLSARAGTAQGAGREVVTLGVVFNHMAERIKVLLEDVRAKAQLEREVSLARTVQETLLPGREGVQVGPLRIAGLVVTADACGGDWWFRAALDDRRIVIGIGDVTGHGLSTSLVATSATSGFASAMTLREPSQVNAQMLITALNVTLANVGRGEHQMSSALAVIDVSNGYIDYAAGAHPSPLVFNKRSGQIASLPARGPLLGASVESEFTSRQAQLRPGDVVVWYTDGLTEARDNAGKLYGTQRLAAAVQAHAHLSAEALRDAVLADARAFSAGQPQRDDITVVVAEFSPAA